MYDYESEESGDTCPHCNHFNHVEVGFQLFCENCGEPLQEPLQEPSQTPYNIDPDTAEVLDDPRYVTFDNIKAFLILKDLNRLDECT
jgi:hypothetical protein